MSGGKEPEQDALAASLADRIASGEFTEGSTKAKYVRPIRELLQREPTGIGKPVWRWLRSQEIEWERIAKERMPEASGDMREILGQPVFIPLQKLYNRYGGVFRLNIGPKSFVVVSDAAVAKEVLKNNSVNYSKGMLSEILEFVMGNGLIPADGEIWQRRKKVVTPAIHVKYLQSMVKVFGNSSLHAMKAIDAKVAKGQSVEMEDLFSKLTLDIIGKAVFNYEFDSLSQDTDIIKAVYAVLREAEFRSTAPIPFWKFPLLQWLIPQQRRVTWALAQINSTLDTLIDECRELIEEENLATDDPEEYISQQDPSILHFLVGMGDDITSKQLRDDLMTLLIAGHETTAAVLTWTMHLLCENPQHIPRLQEEVDRVLGDRVPTLEECKQLGVHAQVIYESMRLYPQPPVLIRRAINGDRFLDKYEIEPGTNLFISTYNIHRSEKYWPDPETFNPERFQPEMRIEGRLADSFTYLPFGGGQRRCIGDAFAMLEAITALGMLVRRFDFKMAPNAPPVAMTTGATIHTLNGLYMQLTPRTRPAPQPES